MAFAVCQPRTWSVTVTACRSREAVCMNNAEGPKPFFYLYDTFHSKLGIKLPFTHFERSVLQALNVAPTQLHPNSWAFVRAVELLCEDLGKALTLGVFFWFFAPRKTDRVGWTSLSNRPKRKLLRPFLESYKAFKDRFFRVSPSDPNSRLFTDCDGRQYFPLQWTLQPAVSIFVDVKILESWERAFILELKDLPVYRSADIIKGQGYSTKALAELRKRKGRSAQPPPQPADIEADAVPLAAAGIEAEVAPLSAAGPADIPQTSQEAASRTPSVFELGVNAPASPQRFDRETDDRPSKRRHSDDTQADDVSAGPDVWTSHSSDLRPQLYKSFVQAADQTIASSTLEVEAERLGLAVPFSSMPPMGLPCLIETERSSWVEQRQGLEEENHKLSSSLAETEAKLHEHRLSTAKLHEILRAAQKMNGELLDIKAKLLQSKTDLQLSNDSLQVDVKRLEDEKAEMQEIH
ncbi:hypothetical protein CR513_41375, partial [Mucuna pruriens]